MNLFFKILKFFKKNYKNHYFKPFFLFYFFNRNKRKKTKLSLRFSLKTLFVGEFGWGGTSVKRQHRCPKGSSMRTEILC